MVKEMGIKTFYLVEVDYGMTQKIEKVCMDLDHLSRAFGTGDRFGGL